jgi:hypothetical protein
MAVAASVIAAVSPLGVLYYGVGLGLLAVSQAVYWSDGTVREARKRARVGGLRRTIRIARLAESGEKLPAVEATEVRPVVELGLLMWDAPSQRVGRRLGLTMILWSFGIPAILGATQGRWPPTIGLVFIGLLLFALERYLIRRTNRVRKTAEVNGWLVNGQVADAS